MNEDDAKVEQTEPRVGPIIEIDSANKRIITTEGKYVCNQCHQQFTSKTGLTRHIQSAHEGVKYACNLCDYQASQQGNLTTHIQSIHEGVKYACNQCDKQFSQQTTLTAHIKRKHL